MEPVTSAASLWISSLLVVATGVVGTTTFYMMRDPAPPPAVETALEPPEAVPDAVSLPSEPLAEAQGLAEPSFDIVRVGADGEALVAGNAAPGARVEILIDGLFVADALADASGRFVAFLTVAPSEVPRILSLRAVLEDEIAQSAETVIISPIAPPPEPRIAAAPEAPEAPEPPEPEAPDAAPAPATEALARLAPEEDSAAPAELAEDAPLFAEVDTPSETSADAPVPAPQLLLADEEGVRVLQSPEAMTSVRLDTITYDDLGEVSLGGRALGEGFVRIYLDDKVITTSPVAQNGTWRTDLPDVDTGTYALRIDEVDATGAVTSRIETPFRREPAAVVAEIQAQEAPSVTRPIVDDVLTVQPGETLWAIARDRYGEGRLFVRVFEANKDRIRNPDLIYPGQVFDLPVD